jgi:hypothetical protein
MLESMLRDNGLETTLIDSGLDADKTDGARKGKVFE